MKFKEALSFFTCMHSGKMDLPKDVKGIFLWFPFVGLIIGFIVSMIMGLSAVILPACFVGIVGCIAWLALTGGAHFQSLAKCGDTLFSPVSEKERKCCTTSSAVPAPELATEVVSQESALEEQKELTVEVQADADSPENLAESATESSTKCAHATTNKTSCCSSKKHAHSHHLRVGVFGFITLFFVLAAKTVALSMLAMHYDIGFSYHDLIHLMFICIGAAMFARCVSFFATLMPTATQEGITYELAKPLFDFHYAVIAVLAFIICYFSGAKAIFMIIMCGAFALYTLCAAKKRFGGLTDDVLACITEVSECLVLIAFCLSL